MQPDLRSPRLVSGIGIREALVASGDLTMTQQASILTLSTGCRHPHYGARHQAGRICRVDTGRKSGRIREVNHERSRSLGSATSFKVGDSRTVSDHSIAELAECNTAEAAESEKSL
jgi:hypothetical protein